MTYFSIGRLHSAHTTLSGILPAVPGNTRRVQWSGVWSCLRWSLIAGTTPFCCACSFHWSYCKRQVKNMLPFAVAISADPLLSKAHPPSLPSKLSIDIIPCITGSFSTLLPSCILDCHILSILTQKYQIKFKSCQQWLSFSALMVIVFLLTRSFGLLFPT